jgi:fumarate reductase flavoprotein subunit
MGVDPAVLTATVEEYNRVCASGRDTVFFKDSENLIPLVGPRYYAIKVYGIFGQAEGPLAANWKGEILDQDSHPIPGLYGAGGAISDLNGRVYTHICAGSRSMFGLVSGQICGEVIPEYIKTL